MEAPLRALISQRRTKMNSVKKAGLKTMKKEETTVPRNSENIQRAFIGNLRKFKTSVKNSMVNTSEKAEKWHKEAAVWPLKVLAKVDGFGQVADDMMTIQTKTIGQGYDLMRTVADGMDEIADEILTRTEKRLAA
jgi:hypothetical protein